MITLTGKILLWLPVRKWELLDLENKISARRKQWESELKQRRSYCDGRDDIAELVSLTGIPTKRLQAES